MIYLYQDKKGCPFLLWKEQMKKKEPAVYRKIEKMLMQMQSNELPLERPNVKKTPPQRTGSHCLYKIRLGSYRLFFLWKEQDYYLLHAFRKSSNATPEKEFRIVKKELLKYQFIPYEN